MKCLPERRTGITVNRDLSVVIVGVFLRSLAGIVFAKMAAASLGPVAYATYGHFYMVASYLVTGSSLGLGNAFSIYVARSRRASNDRDDDALLIVLAGLVCGLVVGAIVIGLFFVDVYGVILPHIRSWNLAWWFTFCVVSSLGTTIQSTMLGRHWQVRYQIATAINPVLSCIALAVAIEFGAISPRSVILTYMVGFAVPLVFYPSLRQGSLRLSRVAWTRLASFSAPYLLPSMLIPTIGAVATLGVRHLIEIRVDVRDLGLWQGLWRLSEGYMGALISIGTALFIPRFSRIVTRQDAITKVSRAAAVLVGLYIPLGLSFLLIPRFVLEMLLSSQYAGISAFLPTEIVGDVFKICYFIQQLLLTCLLRPGLALVGETLFSALFLLSTFLIESRVHSPEGAVAAYSLSYFVVNCLFVPLTWRRLKQLPEA